MKKILSILLGGVFLCPACFMGTAVSIGHVTGDAESLPVFSEDFEAYETGKYIEDMPAFREKWSNNVLDGGEAVGMDAHCREKAQIVAEEGTDNRMLWLNNVVGSDTFFYIGPKNYRYKNFTAEFRVKFFGGLQSGGWISLDCRKDANVWYTGCNNILITLERTGTNGFKPFVYRVFSGSGTGNPKADTDDFESDGYTLSSTIYNSQESNTNVWYSVKYEITDAWYKVYVNDTKIVEYYYPSRNLTTFGNISLNGCRCNCYIDDIRFVSLDEELPPAPAEEVPNGADSSDERESELSAEQNGGERSGCGSGIGSGNACLSLVVCGVAGIAIVLGKKKLF